MPAGVANRNDGILSAALRTAAEYLARGDPVPPVAVPMPRPEPPLPRPQPRAPGPADEPPAPSGRRYRAASISGYMIWSSFVNKRGTLVGLRVRPRDRLRAMAILWRVQPMSERNRFHFYARDIGSRLAQAEHAYRRIGRITASEERLLRDRRRQRIADYVAGKFELDGPPSVTANDAVRAEIDGLRADEPPLPAVPQPSRHSPNPFDEVDHIPLGARNHPDNPFQLERTPPSGPVVEPEAEPAHGGLAELER